jgi:hypothetical protein
MKNTEIAWLAGIIEGDGCIGFNRTPNVIVAMTDKDVVERVAKLFGKHCHQCPPHGKGLKTVYTAKVHATDAIGIMEAIRPYMGKRRTKKIKEVLKLAAARPGFAYGQRQGASVISDADAKVIKDRYLNRKKNSWTGWKIANEYGISQAAVWYIANRRRFKEAYE